MKIFFAILIGIVTSSVAQAQSPKGLKVFCTPNFNTKASITVQSYPDDPLIVVDALKNSLVEAGFKVISEKVAKEKVELSNKGQITDSTFNQDVSLGKTTYIKSVYVITFSYKWDAYNILTDLQGQIVDLTSDGEIVATFSYSKKGMPKKPFTITNAIAEMLKNKSK